MSKKSKKPESIIDVEIFSKEEAQSVISALEYLKRTTGWKYIQQVLENNIRQVEEQILDNPENLTDKDVEILRWRRYYQKALLDTPDIIIRDITPDVSAPVPTLDPWKKDSKEIAHVTDLTED